MWIKILKDGTRIQENAAARLTWLKTSQDIQGCYLFNAGMQSEILSGLIQYWHSRTAIFDPETGNTVDIAERIQGLLPNGKWITITWNGRKYIPSLEDTAIGRPIIK